MKQTPPPLTKDFRVLMEDGESQARRGRLTTPHGTVETPVFMPVGTRGTVKALTPDQVKAAGAEIILANTYHLMLRPGEALVKAHGGLHGFMRWDKPILTDSGGYQVFSLSDARVIDDEGEKFRDPVSGDNLHLTPERATHAQNDLGADIIMAFDECPPYTEDKTVVGKAVERTTRWARRCKEAHQRSESQALFGIVQGGVHEDLRRESAEALVEIGFDGYAVGGLSVGEKTERMNRTLEFTVPFLPEEKPRYLMGVGSPVELLDAVSRGIDMFDCVLPTRNARNGQVFTPDGKLQIRNAANREDLRVIDASCDCLACSGGYTRAYLRHLFTSNEILAHTLLSWHNIAFYTRLMRGARDAIEAGKFSSFSEDFRKLFAKGA